MSLMAGFYNLGQLNALGFLVINLFKIPSSYTTVKTSHIQPSKMQQLNKLISICLIFSFAINLRFGLVNSITINTYLKLVWGKILALSVY